MHGAGDAKAVGHDNLNQLPEFDVDCVLFVVEVALGIGAQLHHRTGQVLEEEATSLVGLGAVIAAAPSHCLAPAAAAAALVSASVIAAGVIAVGVTAVGVAGSAIVAGARAAHDHVGVRDWVAASVAHEPGGFKAGAQSDVRNDELLFVRDLKAGRTPRRVHLCQHRHRELRVVAGRNVGVDVVAVVVGADGGQQFAAVALPAKRVATRGFHRDFGIRNGVVVEIDDAADDAATRLEHEIIEADFGTVRGFGVDQDVADFFGEQADGVLGVLDLQ